MKILSIIVFLFKTTENLYKAIKLQQLSLINAFELMQLKKFAYLAANYDSVDYFDFNVVASFQDHGGSFFFRIRLSNV